MKPRSRRASIVLTALLLLGTAGCSTQSAQEPTPDRPAEEPSDAGGGTSGDTGGDASGDTRPADATSFAWTEFELTDVETGESFTIGELSGTPVYIQSFAVW